MFGITAGTAATVVAGAAPATARQGRRDAEGSWRKLAEGNARFVGGHQRHPHESLRWRESLAGGQHPFAAVLGCADSRVPPELVFDHGLGDLFTVRAAGEVVDEAVLGSVEYAVEHLEVPLVVVLGHANCGAVSAAVDVVRGRGEVTGGISSLVRAIEPAVLGTPADPDDAVFLARCVDNQAKRAVRLLLERSATLRAAVAEHGVRVVAASYELTTGRVTRLT
ncbi:carbonic anhydrase [Saccharothrix coeruleofusca]|uniref:Carbonic anhydrase n=1 Tax=Saccharothrix coeruleofusca TaxID=33919 RepID=A0A918ANC4_9PSEU|nr:carbonic anhydrase [Saccharothrix coeruleofusca]